MSGWYDALRHAKKGTTMATTVIPDDMPRRKPSLCQSGECVEIAREGGKLVAYHDGRKLPFSHGEIYNLLKSAEAGYYHDMTG